ncbi:MAG: CARDB domain-containing protein [Polyangiaceae bacterium]
MAISRVWPLAIGLPLLCFTACGGDPEVTTGSGGAAGSAGAAGNATGGTGAIIDVDGGAGASGSGGGDADACSTQNCPKEQHCEIVSGAASCVPNECSDLNCGPTEECVTTANGAYCGDISCKDDVECPEGRYCDGTICVDDKCAPGARQCSGQDLLECEQNGSGFTKKFSCQSGSPYYQSVCADDGKGAADCPCEDDWDCPANTECEAGVCQGTGVAPTCSLPPEDFTNVLPSNEITWGGTFANPTAPGSPFSSSVQVVMVPLVANLDDDNGDGKIDERDFPELLFTTFCNSDFTTNGVLRAVHGGGPNKGKDFFASCGTTRWVEGDALPATCACGTADLDSTASLAVGDLDDDGTPEIVAVTEGSNSTNGAIRIYSNVGEIIATSAVIGLNGANPAPTLANLDNAGLAEIVVGRIVFTLEKDTTSGKLKFLDTFEGTGQTGANGQGPVSCVANLVGDSKQEIAAGTTLYRMPIPGGTIKKRADCVGGETGETKTFCDGQLVTVWDGQAVNGATKLPNANRQGFCAVADVLGTDQTKAPGPNNPLDGKAEVVSISNGRLYVLNGQTGELRIDRNIGQGSLGGAPNVDDFDGDGFPEIGSAFSAAYVMMDLQDTATECPTWTAVTDSNTNKPRTPPAASCQKDSDCGDTAKFACNEATSACVCLHNGWLRKTEDDSSRVTGSSVFDFNGDGAAEVIYNDECNFRVYDGLNGSVYFQQPSESRTRIEYPVVADVDNDGNAEIVFATTTESGFCSENKDSQYNAGIEVWGDKSDLWVSARRMWNQHAYHVTNITESGRIPQFEPESWLPYNGRLYNTYRSNPRSFGVAPDLTVQAIQVSSPDATCGQLSNKLNITVQIANIGDLRVGPGIVVSFHGTWNTPPLSEPLNDATNAPLTLTLSNSLEPGDVILLTASYDASNNSPGVLPDKVRVVVDDGDQARECIESNNELEQVVQAQGPEADLRVDIGKPTGCPPSLVPQVPTTVFNDGSAPASNVLVRYYAGDPNAGGQPIHDEIIPGPIAAGGNVSVTPTMTSFPSGLSVLIYAVVDPNDAIPECNDGNNKDAADGKITCGVVPQ